MKDASWIRAERERRGWNRAEMARRMIDASSAPLKDVDTLRRYILRWESGKYGMGDEFESLCRKVFEQAPATP